MGWRIRDQRFDFDPGRIAIDALENVDAAEAMAKGEDTQVVETRRF